ncbi:MAG: ABC transporter substrate-binding protein, partial [Eubacteriales bacterium]|nr:ABC transporter substrate-binding protein [Eubacteriales bacterium]
MKKLVAILLAAMMVLGMTSIASAEATPTKLTMWTFISQHDAYYYKMADAWNAEHPDQTIELEVTTLGYDDMHNKMKVALAAGEGAPDICDVELGQFPNVLAYSDHLVELEGYMGDYMNQLVQSRLNIYSKGGHLYGVPYHIGATVMFYNTELLSAAG